jgi:hypothetical protein
MKCINATTLHRASEVALWRDLKFSRNTVLKQNRHLDRTVVRCEIAGNTIPYAPE